MGYFIIPAYVLSLGFLPISVFSLMVYGIFGTLPGLYYLIFFLVIASPIHIYLIRLTKITSYLMTLSEKSFAEISLKLKKANPNIFLFISIGPLFPYIAVLLYVESLKKNIWISSLYLLASTIPGVALVFLITHGIISDELDWSIRLALIFFGLLLFFVTRKKSNNE